MEKLFSLLFEPRAPLVITAKEARIHQSDPVEVEARQRTHLDPLLKKAYGGVRNALLKGEPTAIIIYDYYKYKPAVVPLLENDGFKVTVKEQNFISPDSRDWYEMTLDWDQKIKKN